MRNVTLSLLMIAFYISGFSQVRFSKVDPANGTITIKNFGGDTVNISDYRLCALFQYTNSGLTPLTVVNGSLNLVPDSSVELSGFSLTEAGSDLGLYKPNGAFSDTAAMLDFLQWGTNGNGRESVANSKGIWTTGDFLDITGPYFYQGDGSQNGLSSWSNTSTNIEEKLIDPSYLIAAPNPFTTTTSLNFELAQAFSPSTLSITLSDILGRTVKSRTLLPGDGRMLLNRDNLRPGIYFLNLFEDEKMIARKKLMIVD